MMFRGEKTYLTDLIFMMYLNHLNLKAGYTVGVPVQRDAWCIHYHFDVNMTNYEKYRKIFVEHYMSDVNKEE